ncbi:hypothetical protein Bca4012_006068 [Brassica carinata]
MKSGKNGKTIKGLKDQFVETNKLDHRTRIQLGHSPSWTQDGFSLAVRRAGPVLFGERPRWTRDGFGSAVRRAGPSTDTQDGFGSAVRRARPVQFGDVEFGFRLLLEGVIDGGPTSAC